MQNYQIRDLIDKYERGECTVEELHVLNAWYDDLDRDIMGLSIVPDNGEVLKLKIWAGIEGKTGQNEQITTPGSSTRVIVPLVRQRRMTFFYGSVAACMTGFMVCWLLGLFRAPTRNQEYLTRLTSRGEITKLVLPDHSIAWMNGKSRLRYPKEMEKNRHIFLDEGEVYFSVTHDVKLPFIVVTSTGMRTQVLGTSFTITSYRGMPAEKVIVISGSVRVADSAHNYGVFNKGQGAFINVKNGTGASLTVDTAEAKGWTNGKVILNNVSFAELAMALENTYGITVEFDEHTLGKYRSSITFSRADSLNYVLDILKTIYKIEYKMDKGRQILHITLPGHFM